MQVSIRDFKSRLSAYIRRANAGETLIVTSRNTPVAKVTRYTKTSHPDAACQKLLDMEGVAWDGQMPALPRQPPRVEGAPAARAVLEDRG